jgi:hypothetical protein
MASFFLMKGNKERAQNGSIAGLPQGERSVAQIRD